MTSSVSSPLLINPGSLRDDHLPGDLLYRESQVEELDLCLQPLLRGNVALHAWLSGGPGTGKTHTVKSVLARMSRESGIRTAYINCWECGTGYTILDRLVRDLRILRAERCSTAHKLEKLEEFLGDSGLATVLDEADRIAPKELNTALYNLSRIRRVGLICVSNHPHAFHALEERVRSRLSPRKIEFQPYTTQQITHILRRRCQLGLHPDSWNDRILDRIANGSLGDARLAIRSLRTATYAAEKDGTGKILLRHVTDSYKATHEQRREFILSQQTRHHRLLYDIIQRNPDIRSGTLWEKYLRECASTQMESIATRMVTTIGF